MQIRYSKDSLKFLEKQTIKIVARIRDAISKLKLNPPEGDLSTMKGYTDGRKRLRVGSFRIIYKNISENQVDILLILDIGSRGDIYK